MDTMNTETGRATMGLNDKAACSECDAWAVLLDGGLCPECLAEQEREAQWDELLATAELPVLESMTAVVEGGLR